MTATMGCGIPCGDDWCAIYGCRRSVTLGPPIWGGVLFPQQPQGCICPPTSEQTCQSPTCPRKGTSAARDDTVNTLDVDGSATL